MNILFVCLGNICRSPIAHGLLEKKVRTLRLGWNVDSVGTSNYHEGSPPHRDSVSICASHGLDISHQRSRPIQPSDIQSADLIIVMDASNYQDVGAMCSSDRELAKIKLLLNYVTPGQNRAVPDPYYDGGFDQVYDMIDEATDRLIEELRRSS
ncbi:MAG: low molecular weight protein-tyrosine-phosphatase [Bacteroidota bacterium]